MRSLIPSWGFFNDAGAGPLVEIKLTPSTQGWLPAFEVLPRKPWHLFFNPAGNQRLYVISLIERMLAESQNYLKNPGAFNATATYKIAVALLQASARRHWNPHADAFQFRIRAYLADGVSERQVAFVSELHPL